MYFGVDFLAGGCVDDGTVKDAHGFVLWEDNDKIIVNQERLNTHSVFYIDLPTASYFSTTKSKENASNLSI